MPVILGCCKERWIASVKLRYLTGAGDSLANIEQGVKLLPTGNIVFSTS